MKLKQLMAGLMAVSIAASGLLLGERISAERSVKNVEIVADYTEMDAMAKQSDLSLNEWFKRFKDNGVVSVALDEETFRSLKESGISMSYDIYKVMKQKLDWQDNIPASAVSYLESRNNDYDFVVSLDDAKGIAFIDEGLKRGLDPDMYKRFEETGKDTVFVVAGSIDDVTYLSGNLVTDADEKILERPITPYNSKLELLGLGFDAEKISAVKATGLEVSPRPRNNAKAPWRLIDAFEADLKKYDLHPSHVIFSGGSVLGYELTNVMPLDQLIQMLDRNQISVALIEAGNQRGNTEQDGILYLAENSNYDVIRVFPVIKYIQKRFAFYNYTGAEEIENTIYRAVTERNIRSVYFRPFMKNEQVYVTDPVEYDKMFAGLSKRLADHDLVLGKASGFKFNGPSIFVKMLSALGTVTLAVWVFGRLFDLKDKIIYTLVGLGFLGSSAALFIAPNLGTSLLGLAAAIVYPSAAIYLFVVTLRKYYVVKTELTLTQQILEGAKMLLIGTGISTLGGLSVGAMLSHSSYLIEIDYFRGVKLSLAAPFVIYTIIYLIIFGFKRSKEEIETSHKYYFDFAKLFDLSIKIGYLVILAIAGVIGYVYIARSGHETNLQPSTMEMIFRNILEYELLARPRTKEFLLAFPMVVASIVVVRSQIKELIYPAGLIAVIGFSSIANTFSHLRTPIYLSVVRTAYSVGFGLVVGVFAAILAMFVLKFVRKAIRSFEHE